MGILEFLGLGRGRERDSRFTKEQVRVFEKVHHRQEFKSVVNKAISYRNLGKYRAAEKLLLQVCGQYSPAWAILGNTYRQMGKTDKAEWAFRQELDAVQKDLSDPNNILESVQAYGNLGQLYYFDKHDKKTALLFYKKGLNIKMTEPSGSHLEDQGKMSLVKSYIYLDLASIFFQEGDEKKAMQCAEYRLRDVPDCGVASKVYGLAAFQNYYATDYDHGKYLSTDERCKKLEKAAQRLRVAVRELPQDEDCKAVLALVLFSLSVTAFYRARTELSINTVNELHSVFINELSETDRERVLVDAERPLAALDRILVTEAAVCQKSFGTNVFNRPDFSDVGFPSYGFVVRDGELHLRSGARDEEVEMLQNAARSLLFLEVYGAALAFFVRINAWSIIEERFQVWLDACEKYEA